MSERKPVFTADMFKSLEISTHGAENCAAIANDKAAPLAEELERLRAELASIRKFDGDMFEEAHRYMHENNELRARVAELEGMMNPSLAANLRKAAAENKTLREALEACVKELSLIGDCSGQVFYASDVRRSLLKARAALKGET